MGYLEKEDVTGLLENQEFVDEIVRAVAEDPEAMDTLAEEIADSLDDAFEDNQTVRRKLVEAALATPEFRKRVARKLVAELAD